MRVKDENTREYWEAQLAADTARLKDLEERGIEALSSYDRKMANMRDDPESYLRTSIWLVTNHIAHDRKQLEQFRQATLF